MASSFFLRLNASFRPCGVPLTSIVQRHGFKQLPLARAQASGLRRTPANDLRLFSTIRSTSLTKSRGRTIPFLLAATGVGLGLANLSTPITVHCDAVSPPPEPEPVLPPPPQSSVDFFELTFGTVCGVCAGVFVVKGARAIALVLGGVFVLLQVRSYFINGVQLLYSSSLTFAIALPTIDIPISFESCNVKYLGSVSLVKVDWELMASRFENLFYRTDAAGRRRPPTIGSLLRWAVDFLTADFQARASFIAGFALGLRIG
ncbi:hypothetical protein ID866_3697 [Astraeus odoratus]|nr:hypothetical protein ID866_3697 [Astraeus odoratus]